MFKYSLIAVALIFVAVACNKKEEAAAPVEAAPEAVEAAPAEAAPEAVEAAPAEAAPAEGEAAQ
jgi:hypothetical protein